MQSIVHQVQEMRDVRERQLSDLQQRLVDLEMAKRAELDQRVFVRLFLSVFFLIFSTFCILHYDVFS